VRPRALLVPLACLLAAAVANAGTLSLGDAIARLEAQGHVFVYTKSVADPDIALELPTGVPLDVETFADALAATGLGLERGTDGAWYIVARSVERPPREPSVRGRVTNAITGSPLGGVRVELGGVTAFTDRDGYFELAPRPADSLLIRADGYRAATVSWLSAERILEVPLQPEPSIEEVVVVSSRYTLHGADSPSQHTLDSRAISDMPELGEDVVRVTNHLPGAASVGVSAKPYIRGGLDDETLILFNNVELLEPFHLRDFQNVFASFNPSLIDSVDVYTGGFPARFGDRMSGVMDIRPAAAPDGLRAEVMVSLLTAAASGAGSTNDGRGHWALSARRGNLDFVLDQVDRSTGNPEYTDYYASFGYELSPATEVEAGLIAYDDDVLLKDVDNGDGELGESHYDNVYAWTQLHRTWSEVSRSTTLLSYGNIRHRRNGFINDEDPEEGSSTLDEDKSFDVFSFAHRQYLELSRSLVLELGGRLDYQSGSYDSVAVVSRGALGEIVGAPIDQYRDVRSRPDGTSGGLYASARIRPIDPLTLELGARFDWQDYGENLDRQLSPRFSARYDLNRTTHLRASAGRFYQPQRITELQAADGVSRFQAPQYADHFILGIDREFPAQGLSVRLEGFYKDIRDPKLRFENLFNPWILVPEIASDRVPIEPEKARARGLELSLTYEPGGQFNSWASYSYASSDDRVNGQWQPRSWDQTHSLSTGFIWTPGNWALSMSLLWHSGWRTTRLPGQLPMDTPADLTRNGDELPDFVSLDARIARTWQFNRQSLTVFAEVTNLLDLTNVGAYEYDIEEDDAAGIYLISPERFPLLPRVPSIGIRWSFD